MMRLFCLAIAGLLALVQPLNAAGTVPGLSLTQQLDALGKPLNGGRLYFFAAGTTTPQNVFQDTALTIPYPNPLTLDSAGRIPQLFAADGQIKFRLTNASGITQMAYDNILVVGPSSGGGGGGSVDPTTVSQTGDTKWRYGTGIHTGWVRMNGRTIGSATSGATERANADTQALYEYLWSADTNLPVSGGRGASATADFLANKALELPDYRGRADYGLTDMGNSPSGSFVNVSFVRGSATTLGGTFGTPFRTLTSSQLPIITPSGNLFIPDRDLAIPNLNSDRYTISSSPSGATLYGASGGGSGLVAKWTGTNYSLNINSFGGGQAIETITPGVMSTKYIKL